MRESIRRAWAWLRANIFCKEMIVYVLIAEAIFWSPCIVTGILALTVSEYYWIAFGTICAFWSAPLTPAMPLQFSLALLIKKIVEKKSTKKREKRNLLKGEINMSNYCETNENCENKVDLDLENRFTYHRPNEEQAKKYPVIRDEAKRLAYMIKQLCPNGREQALALTKLEEVVFWVNAGISRDMSEK